MARKIINGKLYNTETATLVEGWWNKYSTNDFRYCKVNLYRKRTGEYFLYGEGGPLSKYRESCGNNSWGSGQEITPLSEQEAMQWAEKHMSVNKYVAEFGEVAE
jgi:hypothetical protein